MSSNPRTRILFLYSDTGGGHRSAAEAIIEAIHLEFPGKADCTMVDVLSKYAPVPLNRAPQLYPPLSRHPAIWGLGYRLSDGRVRTRALYSASWPSWRPGLERMLAEHPCDLLVSVHQLINEPVSRLGLAKGIPFVTVVTDMVSTHAAWFSPRASHVVVPTREAYANGLSNGMLPGQMSVVGMPVSARFALPPPDRAELRSRLGWSAQRTVVMLVGGGEGMGPLEEMALALDGSRMELELALICGRNAALRRRLEAHPWRQRCHVYGFVSEMPSFMHAADILVSKAGPGTISEAFICGLPLILYSRLPGQEEGNVAYVLGTGTGVWAPTPAEMTNAVRRWVENPAALAHAREECRKLAAPRASREIARILMKQAAG